MSEFLGSKQPIYETPAANLRAAQVAMAEMPDLEGEERALQEKRVKDLLDAANEQQAQLYPGQASQSLRDRFPEHAVALAVIIEPRVLPRITLTGGRPPDSRGAISPRLHSPSGHPKYNGTAKPEDWLIDYTTAVGIARGNKRVAVRYVPLMLVDSARTWLNSLPAGNVNLWVDFQEAFVRNFTGTYKRPGRPRELAMCVQRPDEPLRDYVTRWTELHKSYEGVHEVHAIQYFIDGCRDGTLLKHKLMCSEPTSLAVLMAKADKYAMADSAMRVKVTASDKYNFARRLSQGEGLTDAPGAHASPQAPAPPPPRHNDGRLHDDYPHQEGAFVVFTSEGDDKHNQCQHRREVNATVPPFPNACIGLKSPSHGAGLTILR
ncbi:Endoglucanase 3 [Hordeum vulgare]|nr:Endoglucanase 3 [Hordeum vulgare]